jgi:hypothetical protein
MMDLGAFVALFFPVQEMNHCQTGMSWLLFWSCIFALSFATILQLVLMTVFVYFTFIIFVSILMFIWEAFVFQGKDVNPGPGIKPTANDTVVGQYLKNTQVPELQVKRNCVLDEAVSCKWRKVAAGTVVRFKEFSYWYSVTSTVR